jgi:hypothetical protein
LPQAKIIGEVLDRISEEHPQRDQLQKAIEVLKSRSS